MMNEIKFGVCKADDAKWIAGRMSQPDVVEVSFPDGMDTPTAEQVTAAMGSGNLHFVRICADGVPLGFFLLELKFPVVEIHTVISKEHRGPAAFKAAKAFPAWFFAAYPECAALMTQVPKYNRAAALFAMRGGMEKTNIQGDVFCKNGQSDHMEIYVLRKGE